MLRWLYTGTISEEVAVHVERSLQLLCVADRYGVLPLKHHLTPTISASVTVQNVLSVLETADRLQAYQLRRHCLDFLLIHFQEVRAATNGLVDLLTTENRHLMQLVLQHLTSPLQQAATTAEIEDIPSHKHPS